MGSKQAVHAPTCVGCFLSARVVVSNTQLAKIINQGPARRQMRHLDGVERRLDDGGGEHSKETHALAFATERLRPRVTHFGTRVAGQEKDLDVAMPDAFAEKGFVDPNRLDVQRRTAMKFRDDALKRRDILLACITAVRNSTAHKCAG